MVGCTGAFANLSPGFDLDAAAHALQEGESGCLWRRLSIVELKGCESSAFVDGVAEDERLSISAVSLLHFSSGEVRCGW
jgi:hypothetical protein